MAGLDSPGSVPFPTPQPDPGPGREGSRCRRSLLSGLLLALALVLFALHAGSVAFVQDDSYITYRYARNVARGHGPVFNPGERVEGYTNFLWMLLLAALAVLGLSFEVIIPLSQVIGVLCGAGIIVFFHLLLHRYSRGPPAAHALAPFLLAANGAFASWCVSGMESALFSLLLVAAAWLWLPALSGPGPDTARRQTGAVVLLGLAALTRPEGALFFALFCVHYVACRLGDRRLVRRAALGRLGILVLVFLFLVLPHYAWRLGYYGFLFPNTYYAKTGTSPEYLYAGLAYVWHFLQAYGLWGIAVAGPVALAILKKRLRPADPVFFCLLVLGGYTLYIARVGGDVLRNWRFFVPVLFAFYFVLTEGIGLLPLPRRVGTLLLLALVPLTFIGPFTRPRTVREEIVHNLALERDLVTRMTRIGRWLNTRLGPDDWFAATTIGAVSFYSDRNMIDMLGLTDRVIAHEPERILATTWYWRERNYNTAHVLGRTPAFICFSTGVRPSAEAERALFLRPRFRRGYFPALVTITGQEAGRIYYSFETLFQARPDADTIPLEPVAEPTRFVDSYVDAIGRIRFDRDSAAVLLRRCIAEAPEDFGAPWEWLGHVEELRGNPALAVAGFEEALRRDDRLLRAHLNLAVIRHDQGDIAAAVEHMRRVVEYAPDYLDGYTNLAALLVILEQYDAAEELLLRARARFPLIPEIESRLAWTRTRSGR